MEKEHCHCSSEHSEFDGNMPDDNVLYVVSELFKVFGDTTRIKILFLLLKKEMCVLTYFHQSIGKSTSIRNDIEELS